MAQARQGDTVRVHYTGRLDDGSVFDSSQGADPLTFTIGSGQIITGFEDAVLGMNPGETRTTEIPSDRAYGARDEEMLLEVERENLPDGLDPKMGDWLQLSFPDGQQASVRVVEMSSDKVTLDANHPLAGKDLTFEISLVEIV